MCLHVFLDASSCFFHWVLQVANIGSDAPFQLGIPGPPPLTIVQPDGLPAEELPCRERRLLPPVAGRSMIDQFRMAGEPEPQAEPEFPGTLGRSTRRPRVGRAEKELTNLLRWAYDGFVPVRDMHLSHRRLARFTLADLEDAVERNRVYRGAPRFRFRREAGTLWVALSPHLRENRYGQGPDSASGPVPGPDHSGAASTSPGLSESRAVGTPVPATQLYDGGGNIAPWSLAEPGGVDRTAAVVGSGPGQVARGQDFAVDPETGEPLGAAWRPEPPVHTPSLPATDAQEGARLRGPAAPFHDVAAPSGAARNAGAQADGNVYEVVLLQSAVLDDGDTAPPDEEARRRHPEAGAALVIPSSARCAAGSDWIGPEETRLVCRRHGAWRCGICPPTERHPRVADPAGRGSRSRDSGRHGGRVPGASAARVKKPRTSEGSGDRRV